MSKLPASASDAPTNHPSVSSETFAAQAGGAIDAATGAIVPPIHITTTFERAPDNSYPKGYVYGRADNATVTQAEAVITELEQGAATLLSASGMTAATTFFLSLPRPAHVIAPNVMYWSLRNWLRNEAPSFGIEATFVDATDIKAISDAIRPGTTKAIWLETPANPLWSLSDIKAIADFASAHDLRLGVDSTACTPILTQPLLLGADVVMHAATKYLNGHSDMLGGSLTFRARDQQYERARTIRATLGGILGPFDAALLLRGMRTLHVRVRHQCQTAQTIAERFAGDRRVAAVLYPGLPSAPDHELATRQMMGGYGGMMSLRIAGGEAVAIAVAAQLKVWKRATSLGGVESLVEHRASIEGEGTPCPPDLLRLSVGLESVSDLIADLDQALSSA